MMALAIIASLIVGVCIGVVLMAAVCAAGQADERAGLR